MNTKKFPFIAIEGIDGVGKTTCAKLLANRMQAFLYKTPSGAFERIRAEIEAIGDTQVRFAFYLASVFYASDEISSLVLHQPVVCDRYIYTTIAYHRGLDVNLSYIDINGIPIIYPDFCFYLYAEEDVREKRISGRGISSPSDTFLEKDKELQRKIHKEFLKFPVIQIDTSRLNPDEVCEQITKEVLC